MYIITSRENKIYKSLKFLRDKKQREKEGLFMVEGLRGVTDAVKNGLVPDCIVLCEGSEIQLGSQNVYVLAKKLFAEVSQTQTPQGIIAVFKIPEYNFSHIISSPKGFVVLCEDVRDPGNLGTIIRTADAAGCGAVILGKGCCDLYNPKTVRSTVASIGNIPIIRGVDPCFAAERLKSMGYRIISGALDEKSVDLYQSDLSNRVAFVIGNEANGVSPQMLACSDTLIKIPMHGRAESLNAAIAAAVMMYEKVRRNTY